MKKLGCFLCVVSHKRSANVPEMTKHIGNATWVVPEGEGEDYRRAGAPNVVEAKGKLIVQRNTALELAFAEGLTCVMMDDDLTKFQKLVMVDGKKKAKPIDFYEGLTILLRELDNTPYKFAGTPPTANPFFAGEGVKNKAFIIGCFMAIKPCDLRFDEALTLKEDYDYTLQHINAFGGICRVEYLIPVFLHYGNEGGCKTYRNDEREAQAVAYLKSKWPAFIRDNPKRKNEIILTFKGA